MSYANSLVSIVAANQREAVLQIGRALGYEGGLDIPLDVAGSETATHYGAHAWAADDFISLITGDWPVPDGVPAEVVQAAQEAMVVSVRHPCADGGAHFEDVLADLGLARASGEQASVGIG